MLTVWKEVLRDRWLQELGILTSQDWFKLIYMPSYLSSPLLTASLQDGQRHQEPLEYVPQAQAHCRAAAPVVLLLLLIHAAAVSARPWP